MVTKEINCYLPVSPLPRIAITKKKYSYIERFNGGRIMHFRKSLNHGRKQLVFNRPIEWSGNLEKLLISSDESYIAYLMRKENQEQGQLVVKILSMKPRTISINNVFNFCLYKNEVIFTRLDSKLVSSCVYKFDINDPRNICVVFEEKDPQYFVDVTVASDEDAVFMYSNSWNSSEVWIYRESSLRKVVTRFEGCTNQLDGLDGNYYMLESNSSCQRLLRFPKAQIPPKEPLTLLYKTTSNTIIQETEFLGSYACFNILENGISEIHVLNLENGVVQKTGVPGMVASLKFDHESKTDNKLKFSYSSPFIIEAQGQLNCRTLEFVEVGCSYPRSFDRSDFNVKVIHVRSNGHQIPVTLIHRTNISSRYFTLISEIPVFYWLMALMICRLINIFGLNTWCSLKKDS